MKVKSRVFSSLLILVLLLSTSLPVAAKSNQAAVFSSVKFVPNIETIGVAVSGTSLPSTAQLFYRQTGESTWRTGHRMTRINDGRLIGSLFNLSPSTSYDVRVFDGTSEILGSVNTQPEQLLFSPSVILHVDDSASAGGDGSVAAPFQTIQAAVNVAGPGTQVMVADGVYREAVTFPASGTAGNWIQVKAAGDAAILDSADRLSGAIWTATSTSRVYFTKVDSFVAYVARDGKRSYQYDTKTGLLQALGHGNVAMSEGWFYEPGTLRLYVRSIDSPANHTWQVPRLNHAFDVAAREWIWIEGFKVQYYGTTTNGCGVCALNSSHLVIRNNRLQNMQLGIYTNWTGTAEQGNDTRIEGNEVSDPKAGTWPWAAVKGSFMEGTAVLVRGHIGSIVRDNNVHDFFNGIFTGSSATGISEFAEVAFDVDVYHNYIHHILDDALEPEGACVNHRLRNNTIDKSFIGVSIAPVTVGPTWVLRNTFAGFTGRGIKFADASDGVVYLYHNSGWTSAANMNGADLITAIHNVTMRNNIFQSTGYSINEVPTGSTANDWNNDNWYTTRGTTGPHFKWENVNYNTIGALCTARGLECNGYESVPGFANPTAGDFTLLPGSPNIDRGVVIPGINDNFVGNAPDVGAYEGTLDPPPTVLSSVRANASPTNAATVNFTLTFSEPVTGVDLVGPFMDFALTSDILNAAVTAVTPISSSAYTVTVNTGTGNGSIRLDVKDNDSILDSRSNPLGGTGVGNGDFSAGESYTVNKSITTLVNVTFKSNPTYDGWVLESGENTGVGGTLDRGSTFFNVGDDLKDRQYRGFVSFNTATLPDNAVIVAAQLKVKRQGIVGTDPFSTHGQLFMDIRSGGFSSNLALQLSDFAAAASAGAVRNAFTPLTSTWYAAQLSDANLVLINKTGATQFRLSFNKDDNDDLSADSIKFYSGNSISSYVPQLIITYYIP